MKHIFYAITLITIFSVYSMHDQNDGWLTYGQYQKLPDHEDEFKISYDTQNNVIVAHFYGWKDNYKRGLTIIKDVNKNTIIDIGYLRVNHNDGLSNIYSYYLEKEELLKNKIVEFEKTLKK